MFPLVKITCFLHQIHKFSWTSQDCIDDLSQIFIDAPCLSRWKLAFIEVERFLHTEIDYYITCLVRFVYMPIDTSLSSLLISPCKSYLVCALPLVVCDSIEQHIANGRLPASQALHTHCFLQDDVGRILGRMLVSQKNISTHMVIEELLIKKRSVSESALKKSVSSRGPGRCFSLVRLAKPWDQGLLVQEVILGHFGAKST